MKGEEVVSVKEGKRMRMRSEKAMERKRNRKGMRDDEEAGQGEARRRKTTRGENTVE